MLRNEKKNQKKFRDFFLENKKGKLIFQDWGIFLWTVGRWKPSFFEILVPRRVFLAFLTTLEKFKLRLRSYQKSVSSLQMHQKLENKN